MVVGAQAKAAAMLGLVAPRLIDTFMSIRAFNSYQSRERAVAAREDGVQQVTPPHFRHRHAAEGQDTAMGISPQVRHRRLVGRGIV